MISAASGALAQSSIDPRIQNETTIEAERVPCLLGDRGACLHTRRGWIRTNDHQCTPRTHSSRRLVRESNPSRPIDNRQATQQLHEACHINA